MENIIKIFKGICFGIRLNNGNTVGLHWDGNKFWKGVVNTNFNGGKYPYKEITEKEFNKYVDIYNRFSDISDSERFQLIETITENAYN